MADLKISQLTAITTLTPATDVLPVVDVTGTTKKITTNQLLGSGGTATLASATITGDLTVATDRLKVVTGSTAVQTGATTQLQVGTTSWPSTVIGKSGSRSLFGNTGEVVLWTEAAPAIGNYSTLFVTAKTGAGATTMGGLQIRAGIENASNSDGFVSLWTSNSAAGGFVERYKIDSTGVATWSNVGGVAGTAMTLNANGLGVGVSPAAALHAKKTLTGTASAVTNILRLDSGGSGNTAKITLTDGVTSDGYITMTGGAIADQILGFGVNGVNQMVVNVSGNVGIGVTPSAWASTWKAIQVGAIGSLSYSPDDTGYTISTSNGYWNGSNWIRIAAAAVSAYSQNQGKHSWLSAASSSAGSTIAFGDAKMTLDASGNLAIGVAATGTRRLEVKSDGTTNTTFAAHFRDSADVVLFSVRSDGYFNTGTSPLSPYNLITASAANMFVDSSGFVYRSTSSLKYKTDVKDSIHGLADVLKLRSVTYKSKNGDDTVFGGLIAEEVHAAGLTEFVAYAPDKTPDSINYGNMVALLVSAIKELTARVQTLEAK